MFSFNDDELAALESGVVNIGVFFRLDTDDPVRIWLGFGSIDPGITVYDPAGATYAGLGELQDIPTFKQLLNGAAERVEFTLSGVSGEVLDAASGDDADAIRNRNAAVGFALMSSRWELLGTVYWCARYVADILSISQQPSDGGSIMRTVTLSCGSRMTGRRRPAYSYFSDQDQRARHPGDLFCSKVGHYAHGFNKQWPTFP